MFSFMNKGTGEQRQYREYITTKLNHMFLLVATILLQYGIEENVFDCPESHHANYAMTFLLCPMIPLYIISLLLTRELNDTIRGFLISCRFQYRSSRFKARIKYCLKTLLVSLAKCVVPPMTWMSICLLKKRIWVCFKCGRHNSHPHARTITLEHDLVIKEAEAEAQIMGLTILVAGVSLIGFIYIIKQCFTVPDTNKANVHVEALNNYAAYEANAARNYYEEMIQKAAEENARRKVDMFLGCNRDPSTPQNPGGAIQIAFEDVRRANKNMLGVYPRLENPRDVTLSWYDDKEWHSIAGKYLRRTSHMSQYSFAENAHAHARREQASAPNAPHQHNVTRFQTPLHTEIKCSDSLRKDTYMEMQQLGSPNSCKEDDNAVDRNTSQQPLERTPSLPMKLDPSDGEMEQMEGASSMEEGFMPSPPPPCEKDLSDIMFAEGCGNNEDMISMRSGRRLSSEQMTPLMVVTTGGSPDRRL